MDYTSREKLLKEVHRELLEFIKEKFPEVAKKHFEEFAKTMARSYELEYFEDDIKNESFFDELGFILGTEDVDDMAIDPIYKEMDRLITKKFKGKIIKLYRMYDEEW